MRKRFPIWSSFRSGLRLYFHYISINVRSMMQYKTSFLLTSIGLFLASFNVVLGVLFLFKRFSQVNGYTYSEVMLCFSILLMSFSLAEMYARGFDSFPSMVRQGSFDRVLVRPRSTVLQVLGHKFELTRISRILQAVVMFWYGLAHSGLHWTALKVLTIINMLIGGTILFTGIFLVYAAVSFYTIEGLEFMNIFTDGAREFGKYPLEVYGKRVLQITTFLIPYALVQFYPVLYLLERRTEWYLVFLPLLAVVFLIPCYGLWRVGIRHYTSAGS